jgi:hypothetical protein
MSTESLVHTKGSFAGKVGKSCSVMDSTAVDSWCQLSKQAAPGSSCIGDHCCNTAYCREAVPAHARMGSGTAADTCFVHVALPQELSVWAGGTNSQQQRQDQALEQQLQEQPWAELRAGGSGSSAETRGLMARNLMAAYQELLTLMDAVGTIMVQHSTLQVSLGSWFVVTQLCRVVLKKSVRRASIGRRSWQPVSVNEKRLRPCD